MIRARNRCTHDRKKSPRKYDLSGNPVSLLVPFNSFFAGVALCMMLLNCLYIDIVHIYMACGMKSIYMIYIYIYIYTILTLI